MQSAPPGFLRLAGHPLRWRLLTEAVRVMREHGIDISGHRSKHLEDFAGQRFGYLITLCDRVREVCPEFPGHPLAGAGYFSVLRTSRVAQAFLDGAGPAAIGAILGSAILLAGTLREPWQFAVLAGAAVLLLGPALPVVRRGVVLTLLAAAATGLLVALAGGPLPH